MEIIKNIEIVDLCLLLKEEKIVILGDLHLGYEEQLNSEGLLLPKQQFNKIMKRIEKSIKLVKKKVGKINEIIINGDLKHNFGTINKSEWQDTITLIDYLTKNCKKLTIVKGNHDKTLSPILDKRGIKIKDYVIRSKVIICHGDKILEEVKQNKIEVIIIGHEHPAITINDYPKKEKYKCFLKGKWQDKTLIIMPSYNLLQEGSDILKGEHLSPYIDQKELAEFKVYVIGDKIYSFEKLHYIK